MYYSDTGKTTDSSERCLCTRPCAGEPCFTPRLTKAAKNLRPHLLQGCLSDPDPQFLSPYYCTGRSAKYGMPTLRSARGTNRVESHHTPLRSLLGGHRTSPQLASSVLVVHNHRRNHRMAGTVRGVSFAPNHGLIWAVGIFFYVQLSVESKPY